jgi:hypothetical protein
MAPQDDNELSPRLSDSLAPGPPRPDPISNSPAGTALRNFLALMNRAGEDAQAEYEAALEELRQAAEDVIIEIARASNACDDEDYPFRWALVHVAAELRHPAALPFLRNLVLTPIPAERSRDPHSFSTVAEETILRTTAVEGVEYLAVDGNDAALEALFAFLGQPPLSIRRASVQAILATKGGQDLRKRVAALLPEDQHFLLDIKRVDVREVPQIDDPEKHLTEAGRRGAAKAPPRIPGEPEGDAPKVY